MVIAIGLMFSLGVPVFSIMEPGVSAADAAAVAAAESNRTAVAVEALSRLQNVDLESNPRLKEAVLKVLDSTRGTAPFVRIVRQFHLTNQTPGLLEVAIKQPASDAGVEAMRLVLAAQEHALLRQTLAGTNIHAALGAVEALGNTGENKSANLLLPLVTDGSRPLDLRKQAVRALARTVEGSTGLLRLAREEKLAEDLKLTASSELSLARSPQIREEAATLLPLPQGQNGQPLPPVAELLGMKGDVVNGAKVFFNPTVGCATCHQVKGQGTDFGPNLSEIGSKLGQEALFEAILNPSAGISFGFEAWQIQLKSGDEAYGLIVSETADEVAVKDARAVVTRYRKSEITRREQMRLSIMPAGLQQTMTAQQLADLVQYLTSLKNN